MMRSFAARIAPWLLLALVALPTLVAADHVFSHRVYVAGRVIDVEGRPAAGVAVGVAFEGVPPSGLCYEETPEVTGPMGDFELCRHAHAIPADARVTIRAGNASESVGIDPDTRRASANLRLAGPAIHDVTGERTFARVYVVAGVSYAMLDEPADEEGVTVWAAPRYDNVTIGLLDGARIVAMTNVTPEDHGRFLARLDVDAVPAGAIVFARVGLARAEELANVTFRRSDVSLLEDLRLLRGPGDDAPGSDVPAGAWIALGALALSAVAARARRWR